ncbi:MAG: helix-turn-helix transcriptional regulator [Gemmatimonadales bacterium]
MEDNGDTRIWLPLAGLLLAIAVGGAVDIVLDAPTTWRSLHLLYELGLIAAALSMAIYLWRRWRAAEHRTAVLRVEVGHRQAERDVWKANAENALRGMAQAIDTQLVAWQLTPAERDVIGQLLKGRSHKEIAAATGRSDRTVRQHAATAYRKAGLAGRAELAAYFLRDLPLGGTPLPLERRSREVDAR